ncbi:MAG: hypothetical protein DRH07_09640 [Deltaproteobacteria bacterium]|nr:MAG: hypothetical protein DRH07_09640 [Deltaproteobacteria bacterium]
MPAVGGFPPFHSCFEERQKLRLRLQTFAALISNQLFHSDSVTREMVVQKQKPWDSPGFAE